VAYYSLILICIFYNKHWAESKQATILCPCSIMKKLDSLSLSPSPLTPVESTIQTELINMSELRLHSRISDI
jgi:hypothetical protein